MGFSDSSPLSSLNIKIKNYLCLPTRFNTAFFLSQPISSSASPSQRIRGCGSPPSLSASFRALCFPRCPCAAGPLLVSLYTTCKSSSLPLPVILEFQTLLFPNMAGMGALVSTLGQQQNPMPVITLADTVLHCQRCQQHHWKTGRYLCSWLCRVHYKGNFPAYLIVYSFEALVFKEHKISLGRYDIKLNLPLCSNPAPTSLVNPNCFSKVRVTSMFTKIAPASVSWLHTSAGLCPTDHDLLHETQEI